MVQPRVRYIIDSLADPLVREATKITWRNHRESSTIRGAKEMHKLLQGSNQINNSQYDVGIIRIINYIKVRCALESSTVDNCTAVS